ncbi:glycosyltransferase 87 family protein [Duganella levis]|uniref:DUF2029 domain-containing protein n=1 Tax=Duganella levis TaxID=2692169 RepID=A0ABW9W8F2_9BURK|nr:glycosyltransferase 87 family protein [Duganella levis]MYN30367.1 DUF2029 domain-containing protein [Duganella levis]
MNLLQRPLIAFERAVAAAWQCLDRPAVLARALLLIPLLFGALSLLYGQDDNWDLHNYHLYNPYALLNGKIGYDLAPGQWQSYFNPTIDLLYYGLNALLPAPAAGFVMGWLHGLNFVLLAAIGRQLMPPASHRAALLLALAGSLGPGFISEIGNTMGDNLIALTVLGALLLLLRAWPQLMQGGAAAWRAVALAGLLAGLGTGLKLTNAMYALALCLALLGVPATFWLRFRLALVFGLGTLAGIGLSAGHWYWRMWQTFGNPLFPQFNNIFKGPLAATIGIGDTGWIPQGLKEKLLWPFIFTYNPKRVIEIPITQLIWPMLYLAGVALALRLLRDAILAQRPAAPLARPAGLLLLFFGIAYLIWLNLFGIYRYLVPLELLAPLALWLAAQRLMAPAVGRQVAAWALLLATVAGWSGASWGHASWARQATTVELPPLPAPAQNIVFTVHGDPPMSWLVPSFPRALAFVALGGGFPESPAYAAKAAAMMAERSGPFYVMLQAEGDNQKIWPAAQEVLGRYGMRFNPDDCLKYRAAVGSSDHPYQLCPVQPAGTGSK